MSYNNKKFLDANGVTQIVGLLDDYATNETLSTVVNSVQTALDQKVSDVQINGASILNNGVANVPLAGQFQLGVVKTGYSSTGIFVASDGTIYVSPANDATVKSGNGTYTPITPTTQHKSVFYGLTKLAGVDMAQSSNPVGTYTDAALQAIQKLFGLAGILGPYEDDLTADRAYAIGETFVMDGKRYRATAAIAQDGLITPGTNCELDPIDGHYIKDTDYATTTKAGVFKMGSGLTMQSGGVLAIGAAGNTTIKDGTSWYFPIVPATLPNAIYYGLSKLAGVDLKNGSNTVGVYTEESKTAIQSMLGVSTGAILIENVTGTTPTITALPNVRYKCSEVSILTITPPASGSCEIIFSSGSTATTLTVPNTIKWPAWFDATALEANTIYDIIITDATYGAVMSWAS